MNNAATNHYIQACVWKYVFIYLGYIPQSLICWIIMATHSSILAWKIAWTEEPGKPQSMGLQRVRDSWVHVHHSNSTFNLLMDCRIAFKVVALFYLPTSSLWEYQFVCPYQTSYLTFWVWPSSGCEIESQWFWFAFSWLLVMLSIFSLTGWPFVYLFWKNVYLNSLSFKKLDNLSVFYWVVRVLGTNSLSDAWFANSFSMGFVAFSWWYCFV